VAACGLFAAPHQAKEARLFRFALLAIITAPILATAAGAESLEGWGPYKFGMTLPEIATVNGGQLVPGRNAGSFLDMVDIGGQNYSIILFTSGIPASLILIRLLPNLGPGPNDSECDIASRRMLASLRNKYGALESGQSVGNSDTFTKHFTFGAKVQLLVQSHCNIMLDYDGPKQPARSGGF
jgi:hypothetical protein